LRHQTKGEFLSGNRTQTGQKYIHGALRYFQFLLQN
jgi:hypothetical protein